MKPSRLHGVISYKIILGNYRVRMSALDFLSTDSFSFDIDISRESEFHSIVMYCSLC
jgi:hypothetical protein